MDTRCSFISILEYLSTVSLCTTNNDTIIKLMNALLEYFGNLNCFVKEYLTLHNHLLQCMNGF